MKKFHGRKLSRRGFVAGAAALAGVPVMAQARGGQVVQQNASAFRTLEWRPYFKSLRNGAILVDTSSRALHFWSEDGQTYMLFPTSVPMSPEMIRRGKTTVTRKVVGPDWSPTASMIRRDPGLPRYVPPGPDNPLGTHALYLGWKYYRIHGTHDPRKIGRMSSSGCIGLFNKDIATLFEQTKVGTQVVVL